jgi:hypothetical protein
LDVTDMQMSRPGLFLVGIVACVLSSCSVPPTKPDARPFTVKLKLEESHPQAQGNDPGMVHVWMSPVPGNIFGSPTAQRLIDMRVAQGAEFAISAADLESKLAAAATTSTVSPFQFEPSDTKVARVGTFVATKDKGYTVGFEDPTLEHLFVLVYVDRPCLVKGPGNDLMFERRGLHWLRADLPLTGPKQSLKLVDSLQVVVLFASSPR